MVEDVLDLDSFCTAQVGDVVAREVLAQRAEPSVDLGWLWRQGKLDEDADLTGRPSESVDAGPELIVLHRRAARLHQIGRWPFIRGRRLGELVGHTVVDVRSIGQIRRSLDPQLTPLGPMTDAELHRFGTRLCRPVRTLDIARRRTRAGGDGAQGDDVDETLAYASRHAGIIISALT